MKDLNKPPAPPREEPKPAVKAKKKNPDLVNHRDIEAYVEYGKRDQAMDETERNELI